MESGAIHRWLNSTCEAGFVEEASANFTRDVEVNLREKLGEKNATQGEIDAVVVKVLAYMQEKREEMMSEKDDENENDDEDNGEGQGEKTNKGKTNRKGGKCKKRKAAQKGKKSERKEEKMMKMMCLKLHNVSRPVNGSAEDKDLDLEKVLTRVQIETCMM